MKLHLNVFGLKARDLIRDALCESSIQYDSIEQATDNEIIIYCQNTTNISINQIIRRLKWYAKTLSSRRRSDLKLEAKRILCLADLLNGIELRKVEKKYNDKKITDVFNVKRLNPFITEAIDILENKKQKIRVELHTKLSQLREQIFREANTKCKEIDEEIEKLRNQNV